MTERRGLHRFRVCGELTSGATIDLSDGQARQIRNVLRLSIDSRIVVFDGQGTECLARPAPVGRSGVVAEIVGAPMRGTVAGPPEIHLGVAMLKADRFDLVVQKAAELGVSSITPIATERSVVKLTADRARARVRRWRRIAVEALEQSGRADDITIEHPTSFGDSLKQFPGGCRFVAWEGETDHVIACALNPSAPAVSVLVGPEGGFTCEEVMRAEATGFQTVSLGPLTLRAETAAIVVPAMIRAAINRIGQQGLYPSRGD